MLTSLSIGVGYRSCRTNASVYRDPIQRDDC